MAVCSSLTLWMSTLLSTTLSVHDFELYLLVFKAMHGRALDYMAAMCQPVSSVEAHRRLRPAADGHLIVSASNTVFGDRAFFISATKTWKNLPAGIRSSFRSVYSNMLWKLFCLTGLMASSQSVSVAEWVRSHASQARGPGFESRGRQARLKLSTRKGRTKE